MKKITFLTGAALALLPCPVLAQDGGRSGQENEGEPLIVSDDPVLATIIVDGVSDVLRSVPASVAKVTGADLERLQAVSLTDALARIPGVGITRNGPVGALSSLRIRGADAGQTLVVIDGVRVNDPTSPGGGFDFGSLLGGAVSSVDVLRGTNSLVWGSDAIGGVVLVQTGNFPGDGRLTAEYGSRDSVLVDGQIQLSDRSAFNLSVGGGFYRTDGISAAAAGNEPDGYRQYRANGRLTSEISDGLLAMASIYYADSRLDIDGFAPPSFTFGDTADRQVAQEIYASAGVAHDVNNFSHGITIAIADINRDTFDGSDALSFGARGRSEKISWQGEWRTNRSEIVLSGGLSREWLRSRTRDAFSADAGQTAVTGAYGLAVVRPVDAVRLSAGVRYDDHRRFGGNTTLSGNATVDITDHLLARVSYAEGFKAPTLFQLSPTASGFGNPALQPETARSYDIGLRFNNWLGQGNLTVEASLYRRDSRNLIDFVSCTGPTAPAICAGGTRPFGTYANIGRARAEGGELEVQISLPDGLTFRGGYAFTGTRDRTTGNRLARRPVHSAVSGLDYRTQTFSLGGDVRLVGDSFDDAGNFTRLDSYILADIRGSVNLTDQVELYGRVENLFDTRYQNVAGYGTFGRSAFIGVRARL